MGEAGDLSNFQSSLLSVHLLEALLELGTQLDFSLTRRAWLLFLHSQLLLSEPVVQHDIVVSDPTAGVEKKKGEVRVNQGISGLVQHVVHHLLVQIAC